METVVTLFVDSAQKNDNGYSYNINIKSAWSTISGLLSELLSNPSSLGEFADIVATADDIIAALAGGLYINDNGSDRPVADINDLIVYIDQNLPECTATLNFNFAGGNFKNADITVKYAEPNSTTLDNTFKLDIPTFYVGDKQKVDVTENFAISKEERNAMEAFNILTFQANGRVNFSNPLDLDGFDIDWGVDTLYWNWSINSDLNPFVLFSEKGFLIENLEKMGYINLSIDMPQQGNFEETSIIKLHCDFSSGYFAVDINLPSLSKLSSLGINVPNGISGVFEFDALQEYIENLINPSAKSNVAMMADGDSLDIAALLEQIMSEISFSSESGLVIESLSSIANTVIGALGVDLSSLGDLGNYIGALLPVLLFEGADTIGLTVNAMDNADAPGFAYGKCDRVDISEIPTNGFFGLNPGFLFDVNASNSDFIKTELEYGEPLSPDFDDETIIVSGEEMALVSMFYIKGMDATGKTQYGRARYIGNNYNPYMIGKQTVTITYSQYNPWFNFFNGLAGLLGQDIVDTINNLNLPLGGLQTFDIDVEVKPPVEEGDAVVSISGSNTLALGDSAADILNAVLIYNGRKVKVTSDMVSCAAPILDKDGNAIATGAYTLMIKYYTAVAYVDVTIGGIVYRDIDIVRPGQDVHSILYPQLQVYENGRFINTPIDYENVKLYLNDALVDSSMIFEDGTTLLKNDKESLFNKKLTLEYSYILYGVEKTSKVNLTIRLADNDVFLNSTAKLDNSNTDKGKLSIYDDINGLFTIDMSDGTTLTFALANANFLSSLGINGYLFVPTYNGNPLTAQQVYKDYRIKGFMNIYSENGTLICGYDNDSGEVVYLNEPYLPVGNYRIECTLPDDDISLNKVITVYNYINCNLPDTQSATQYISYYSSPFARDISLYYYNGAYVFGSPFYGVNNDIKLDFSAYKGYGTSNQKEVELSYDTPNEGFSSVYINQYGNFTLVLKMTYRGYTETNIKNITLTEPVVLNPNSNTDYSIPTSLLDGILQDTQSFSLLKYNPELGYGFFNSYGEIIESFVSFNVYDEQGNLVQLVDGKINKGGTFNLVTVMNYNGIEYTITHTLEVTDTALITADIPQNIQISDSIGSFFSVKDIDGNIISDKIAYFGDDGYRYIAENGSAITDYEISITTTAPITYGSANEMGARNFYITKPGKYTVRIFVTRGDLTQYVITDLTVIEAAVLNANLNVWDNMELALMNINILGTNPNTAVLKYLKGDNIFGLYDMEGGNLICEVELNALTETTPLVLLNGKIKEPAESPFKFSVTLTFNIIFDSVSFTISENLFLSPYITIVEEFNINSTYFNENGVTGKFKAFDNNNIYTLKYYTDTQNYKILDDNGNMQEEFDIIITNQNGEIIDSVTDSGLYYFNITTNLDDIKYQYQLAITLRRLATANKNLFSINTLLNEAFKSPGYYHGIIFGVRTKFSYNATLNSYCFYNAANLISTPDMKLKVFDDQENEYTLVNGTITEAGNYTLELSIVREDGSILTKVTNEITVTE